MITSQPSDMTGFGLVVRLVGVVNHADTLATPAGSPSGAARERGTSAPPARGAS
ncbi:MAG: hypothetical protein K8I82_30190 [Anaerolineae bacterium]|nr:hypothetical protein [Anaerolineae bacterium]